MIKTGFLFDLDGVLIDSENEYTAIWDKIDRAFPSGKKDFSISIKGQTLNKILEDNYSPDVRLKVTEMLHRLEKEMKYTYCSGADRFLELLNRRNHLIAVVTSSDETKMYNLKTQLPDFSKKINVLIDAGKVSKSKPDPEGYLMAADCLGVNIRNCAVFEDSVQGVKAGRSAGALVIGITGTKSKEELAPYCDMVINCLSELEIDTLHDLLTQR